MGFCVNGPKGLAWFWKPVGIRLEGLQPANRIYGSKP